MGIHKFITNIIIISFTIGNIYDRIRSLNCGIVFINLISIIFQINEFINLYYFYNYINISI